MNARAIFCADVRMINNSGIGVYIQKYIQFILEANLYNTILIGRKSEVDHHFGNFHNWRFIEANFSIYSIIEQIKLPLLIPYCDIFWSPHYNIPLLPLRAKYHLVTIPDVYHLAHYNTLNRLQKIYTKIVTNAAVRKASKIITISNYSKQEIQRLTGVNTNKIEVIYLGIDNKLFRPIHSVNEHKRVREKYNLPKNFILFIGNVKPNKNLQRLVTAFAILRNQLPNIKLVIAGKQEGFITGDPILFNRIQSDDSLVEQIVFTGFVDSEDLPVLYSLADLFVFPSIYEGFGFPPLEAMACHCPVVASNASSIPEICGEAALYVNPLNPEDIAKAIQIALTGKLFRSQLVTAGIQQYQQYDWYKSSLEFIRAVDKILC